MRRNVKKRVNWYKGYKFPNIFETRIIQKNGLDPLEEMVKGEDDDYIYTINLKTKERNKLIK